MAQESRLWQKVNALGGKPANTFERGFCAGVDEALSLIEPTDAALIDKLERLQDRVRHGSPKATVLDGIADILRFVAPPIKPATAPLPDSVEA